jgi:hypothetical protein
MNLPYFKTFLMLTYRFSIFLCCRQELARKRKTTKSRRRRSWEMTLRMKRARGGVDENGSEIANYHESNFLLRSEHKVMA